MSFSDIPVALTAIGAFLLVLGGGAKWLLVYIDSRASASAVREDEARKEMRAHLDMAIQGLKKEVDTLTAHNHLYLRRVLQLEAYIQGQKGWEMPKLEGWPPQ